MMTSLRHKLSKANGIRQKFGLKATLQYATNVVGSPLCNFEALTLVWLPVDEVKISLDIPDDTAMRFLTPAEVETFA